MGFDPAYPNVQIAGMTSPEAIQNWLSQNIQYKTDQSVHGVDEYWQTPSETYALRSGDCEDWAILMMYLIRTNLAGDLPKMYFQPGAMWDIWVEWNGTRYLPGGGTMGPGGDAICYDYELALYIAANRHRP